MKTYLGDAVYAEWDGSQLILTTEYSSDTYDDIIYLDEPVLFALDKLISKIKKGEIDE